MSRWWLAAGLAALLAVGPAAAQDKQETPRQLFDEAAEKLVRAIELMLLAIPQYEAPEVLPNGDIIIRRKNPEAPKKPEPPKEKMDRT